MSVEEYRKAAVDAVQKLSVDVGIPTKLKALKEHPVLIDRYMVGMEVEVDAISDGTDVIKHVYQAIYWCGSKIHLVFCDWVTYYIDCLFHNKVFA